ncbi:MAG: trans-aconitate 2-methyltransferase [Halobacteriaceae archaeon]
MYEGTIDWDAYWREECDAGALDVTSDDTKVTLLERFFEQAGTPASVASVGCGDATLPAALAGSYPETAVWGFDAAPAIIEQNRETYADRDNLRFDVAALPGPEIDRQFELVYCYGTLHYVRETAQAMRDLYDLVAPGGHLVVNYPNAGSQAAHQEHTEVDSRMYERFELVYEGENLLSGDRIADLLDAPIKDFWAAVDAPDTHWTKPGNPCVYVRRPSR